MILSIMAAAIWSSVSTDPPPRELEVGCHDQAPPFVALGHDLEQEPCALAVYRQVAQLVQDDQIGALDLPEHAVEGSRLLRLLHPHDEVRYRREHHRQAHVAGGRAASDCHMRLAVADAAVQHQVLHRSDERARLHVVPGHPLRQPYARPVVAVEGLQHREPRPLEQPLPLRLLAPRAFLVEHRAQEPELPRARFRRELLGRVVRQHHGAEPCAGPRLKLRPRAHAAPHPSRPS